MASHNFIYATVDENGKAAVLGTLAPGEFTDILSESGASAVSSKVTQLSIGPVVPSASPQLVWSADLTGDGKRLAQEGYVLIGTSSFLGCGEFSSRRQGRASDKPHRRPPHKESGWEHQLCC